MDVLRLTRYFRRCNVGSKTETDVFIPIVHVIGKLHAIENDPKEKVTFIVVRSSIHFMLIESDFSENSAYSR